VQHKSPQAPRVELATHMYPAQDCLPLQVFSVQNKPQPSRCCSLGCGHKCRAPSSPAEAVPPCVLPAVAPVSDGCNCNCNCYWPMHGLQHAGCYSLSHLSNPQVPAEPYVVVMLAALWPCLLLEHFVIKKGPAVRRARVCSHETCTCVQHGQKALSR
jgi:hypothetical protein